MFNTEQEPESGTKEITIGRFLTLLSEGVLNGNGACPSDIFTNGRTEGWFTEQEELFTDRPLERRAAARLLHGVLKYVLKEADEENWQAAMMLKDLFDCGSCVMHVAQVFVKGIMDPERKETEEAVFGMAEALNEEEAIQAIKRLKSPELRQRREEKKQNRIARRLSKTEALELLETMPEAKVVWVGKTEAPKELQEVLCIPMMHILENPFVLEQYRNCLLLIGCEAGYQSEIAANCLAENGYAKVAYFGMNV